MPRYINQQFTTPVFLIWVCVYPLGSTKNSIHSLKTLTVFLFSKFKAVSMVCVAGRLLATYRCNKLEYIGHKPMNGETLQGMLINHVVIHEVHSCETITVTVSEYKWRIPSSWKPMKWSCEPSSLRTAVYLVDAIYINVRGHNYIYRSSPAYGDPRLSRQFSKASGWISVKDLELKQHVRSDKACRPTYNLIHVQIGYLFAGNWEIGSGFIPSTRRPVLNYYLCKELKCIQRCDFLITKIFFKVPLFSYCLLQVHVRLHV